MKSSYISAPVEKKRFRRIFRGFFVVHCGKGAWKQDFREGRWRKARWGKGWECSARVELERETGAQRRVWRSRILSLERELLLPRTASGWEVTWD